MKPNVRLAETTTPEGGLLQLFEHDGSFAIRLNGHGLMDSRMVESERVLGELGTSRIADKQKARILIGGLGLGFTLGAVLDNVTSTAEVHVAELLPTVVDWNRTYLQAINGNLLDDPRVQIHTQDVRDLLMRARPGYDAILLDIDNGPTAMVQDGNVSMYSETGLALLGGAIRNNGRAVFWSAAADPVFEKRLRRAGFAVEVVRVKRYATAKRASIFLYVADSR